MLAACASTKEELARVEDVSAYMIAPVSAQEAGPATRTASIVVFRDSPVSLALAPKFRLDGREIGRCAFNRSTVVEVAPGAHTISSFSESDNTRKFVIEAGETAYIRCSPAVGVIVPNVRLEFVSEEVGRGASAGMNVVRAQ